ncbi:RNA polymerase sigma factor SigW [Bacillus sp. SG-1]|nr:RNA polymerase sigma factor SigW [Bacillus sp. SG-1]
MPGLHADKVDSEANRTEQTPKIDVQCITSAAPAAVLEIMYKLLKAWDKFFSLVKIMKLAECLIWNPDQMVLDETLQVIDTGAFKGQI